MTSYYTLIFKAFNFQPFSSAFERGQQEKTVCRNRITDHEDKPPGFTAHWRKRIYSGAKAF